MGFSLNSLNGLDKGVNRGLHGVIKGDTRSLDYDSYGLFSKLWAFGLYINLRHHPFWGTKMGPKCWKLPVCG